MMPMSGILHIQQGHMGCGAVLVMLRVALLRIWQSVGAGGLQFQGLGCWWQQGHGMQYAFSDARSASARHVGVVSCWQQGHRRLVCQQLASIHT